MRKSGRLIGGTVRPGAELRDGSAAAPVAEHVKPADWDGLRYAEGKRHGDKPARMTALCWLLSRPHGVWRWSAANLSQAQPATEYQPSVGQEGKDVVWVPTNNALVDKMLDLANVTASDFLVDLGSPETAAP